mgnify:CR=1 FL=1
MSARYELIDAQKASYAVVKMCSWLGVSRSGFYEWASRPESATASCTAVNACAASGMSAVMTTSPGAAGSAYGCWEKAVTDSCSAGIVAIAVTWAKSCSTVAVSGERPEGLRHREPQTLGFDPVHRGAAGQISLRVSKVCWSAL